MLQLSKNRRAKMKNSTLNAMQEKFYLCDGTKQKKKRSKIRENSLCFLIIYTRNRTLGPHPLLYDIHMRRTNTTRKDINFIRCYSSYYFFFSLVLYFLFIFHFIFSCIFLFFFCICLKICSLICFNF